MDEETFVDLWVAYAVAHSLDINPTIDDLNKMEEEELKKNKKDLCNVKVTTQVIFDTQVNARTNQEITYPLTFYNSLM